MQFVLRCRRYCYKLSDRSLSVRYSGSHRFDISRLPFFFSCARIFAYYIVLFLLPPVSRVRPMGRLVTLHLTRPYTRTTGDIDTDLRNNRRGERERIGYIFSCARAHCADSGANKSLLFCDTQSNNNNNKYINRNNNHKHRLQATGDRAERGKHAKTTAKNSNFQCRPKATQTNQVHCVACMLRAFQL